MALRIKTVNDKHQVLESNMIVWCQGDDARNLPLLTHLVVLPPGVDHWDWLARRLHRTRPGPRVRPPAPRRRGQLPQA